MPRAQMESLIDSLTEQMHQSAADLQFEVAARLRDEIKELKRELRDMREAAKRFEFEKAAKLRDTIRDLRTKEFLFA